ncbi:hypothetical protein ACNQFN_11325 [Thauera butanivorans]|uniref:hypothetical protein n=1 Tax=Thauera butanivorans TaxID=86174 RepID=UPI003AB63C8E
MPIFNVVATKTTRMVVVAEDEDHAWQVAQEHARQAFDDANEPTDIHVSGEVRRLRHLRDGWDGDCVPYGGDRNTRLRDLLPGESDQ